MRVSAIDPNGQAAAGGLEALLQRHRTALLRYLVARRAAPDEAEDILQDLFVKLRERGAGPVADPRAYLYRMAENLLVDRRRSARRRAGREDAWTAARLGAPGEADGQPSAEQRLVARERLAAVRQALAALPERSVHVLRRFRLDGMPQREIASELGISLSAVEKHLQRAYRVLIDAREALDAEPEPPRRPNGEGEA